MFTASFRIVAPLLALFVLTAGTALPQEKDKFTMPRALPGDGVADPAGKIGFFANTSGGIDALDLANGKVLWSSKEGNRPLLALENRLIVQSGETNHVRVLVLDTSNEGKRILESDLIKFPDWVSVKTTYGRTFQSGARVDAKGVYLSWDARAFYAGGARPTPEIEAAARKSASGVSRVELDKGKVDALDADSIKAGKFLPIQGNKIDAKVGALTLTIEDRPSNDKKNPFQQRRTLKGMNKDNKVVWEHEIKAPVFLLPLP